jgi:hypothetical protein
METLASGSEAVQSTVYSPMYIVLRNVRCVFSCPAVFTFTSPVFKIFTSDRVGLCKPVPVVGTSSPDHLELCRFYNK